MNIINFIMNKSEILAKPPVLIDIGASGTIHHKWKKIAKYSICLAFDPDKRDIQSIKNNKKFKKIYFIDSLIYDKNKEKTPFYLTNSPYCSSMLEPYLEELKNYSFYKLFQIKDVVDVKAVTINSILKKYNLEKIDWFKVDAQGIDLKIFKSMKNKNRVLMAEFEPGIINAYKNEDKLSDVLQYMQKKNFWMSECIIKGHIRVNHKIKVPLKNKNQRLTSHLKHNPGWAEVTYANDFKKKFSKRDILLGIVFNYIENNIAFCLELVQKGIHSFPKDLDFKKIEKQLLKKLNKLLQLTQLEDKAFKELISKIKSLDQNDSLIIYGNGNIGKALHTKYSKKRNIHFIIDKNNTKKKQSYIKSLDEISSNKTAFTFIVTIINEKVKSGIISDIKNRFPDSKIISI